MRRVLRTRWRRRAQSTVEYLLVISVFVIAIYGTFHFLAAGFRGGMREMNSDVRGMTERGHVEGE